MIVRVMQLGVIGTNCYILGDEETKACAVIDPGDDAPDVLAAVKKLGLELRAVFLTHGHYDHTTGVPGMHEAAPQVPIYIHKADITDNGQAGGLMMPFMEGLTYWDEGDTVKVGNLIVEVMHTPGHSEGSVTLRVGEVLFTGDTLFRGSMGRTDFPGGSYRKIMASLRRLYELPGDYQVCPGHEGMSTLQQERKSNYYMQEAMGN